VAPHSPAQAVKSVALLNEAEGSQVDEAVRTIVERDDSAKAFGEMLTAGIGALTLLRFVKVIAFRSHSQMTGPLEVLCVSVFSYLSH
jgi:hypothetical protein